jgi:hypothetical protein
MVTLVVLVVLGAWILLAVLTLVAAAAVVRSGAQEDRIRGLQAEPTLAEAAAPAAPREQVPVPTPDGSGLPSQRSGTGSG